MNIADHSGPTDQTTAENSNLLTNFPWYYTPANGYCVVPLAIGESVNYRFVLPQKRGGYQYLSDDWNDSCWYLPICWADEGQFAGSPMHFGLHDVTWQNTGWSAGFEGWVAARPTVPPYIVRTAITVVDKDTLNITGYFERPDGSVTQLGSTIAPVVTDAWASGLNLKLGWPPQAVRESGLFSYGQLSLPSRNEQASAYMVKMLSIVKG